MNHATTPQATKKLVTKPVASTPQRWGVMSTCHCGSAAADLKNAWASLSSEAPNMTGIARKKENSTAAGLDSPTASPATIVANERLVPGNAAATICAAPISI